MPIFTELLHKETIVHIWKITEPESFFIEKTGLKSNIKSDKRRIEFLAGRFLLQQMIPEIDLSKIKISEIGKPYLEDDSYHFSISHSYPFVAVAVSEKSKVGVDIQVFRDKILRLQGKFLNEREMELTNNDEQLLTLFWSAKEALFKWKATGGQDFSEQLLINDLLKLQAHYQLNCTIKNKDNSYHELSLLGKIFEKFSLVLAV